MAMPESVVGCPEALEALEVAAVEPRGLETLAEGSTPEDAAVVAHVAGCAPCAAEAARLREIAALLRAGLAPVASPDLRGTTLAYIQAVGRPRGADSVAAADGRDRLTTPVLSSSASRGRRLAIAGLAMAAVVVVAVGASALVATGAVRSELAAERERSALLARKSAIALRVLEDPRAIRIPMTGSGGASGVAVISPGGYAGGFAGAVVATNLPAAPAGSEYVCYVVIDGQRRLVGRMAEDGTMHAWAGPLDAFADARPDSVGEYGVLLVPAGSDSVDGAPVVAGSL
jgi:hypothetical protein